MNHTPFRRLLTPVRRALDRYETAPCRRPAPEQDAVYHPAHCWDLGTLIAVFPQDAPFRFLDLNWVLGLTGTSFDRSPTRSRAKARDAFDLQLCLEGTSEAAVYKGAHSISREASYTPGRPGVELADRLTVTGGWPHYEIRCREPGADLELDMRFSAWPGIHWWACVPRVYCHYSNFGTCELTWRWGHRSGELEVPALLEHGWGNHLLPVRVPLGVFRYEVLGLPDAGIGISLWVDTPGGLELANAAVHRRGREAPKTVGRYRCDVLEWERFENHAGQIRHLPRRWRGHQQIGGGEMVYEAERITPPRTIMGDGCLHAFSWRGEGATLPGGCAEGTGYVEQMGRLRPRAAKRGE